MIISKLYNIDDFYSEWAIKKFEGSEQSILSSSSILEWTKDGRFNSISDIRRTYYGRPYIKIENNKYILTNNIKGKKIKLSDKEEVISAIKCLAEFHLAAEGYLMPSGIKTVAYWGRGMEEYKTLTCHLEKYADLLDRNGCKNSFEKETRDHLDYLYKTARKSIEFFRSEKYIDAIEKSMKRREICINDFTQNSVIMLGKSKKPFITKIFSLGYNMCEEDIASMARRYIEETGCIEFLEEIISEYDKKRSLNSVSKENIRHMTLFPETPLKIISKYLKKGLYKENMLESFLSIASIYPMANHR